MALALFLAGCGSGSGGSRTAAASTAGAPSTGFSWLHPAGVPAGWRVASIPDGARLPVPPGWAHAHGDVGSATVELAGPGGQIVGYLNITPRQGRERLSTWAHFRVAHNADEGDRNIRPLAAAQGLRFPTGTGSCVKDSYLTKSSARYIELACLVAGKRSTTVIIGAAPPTAWGRISPLLERAISGFET